MRPLPPTPDTPVASGALRGLVNALPFALLGWAIILYLIFR